MPKYKVGDVAALFPKPAKAKTGSGKKMQSLFEDFYSKSTKFKKPATANKLESQNEKKSFPAVKIEFKAGNKSPKSVKRKFKDFNSTDPSFQEPKAKKRNLEGKANLESFQSNKYSDKVTENTTEEAYFPRNNKKNTNFKPEAISEISKEIDVNEHSPKVDKAEMKRLKKEKRKLRRQQEILQQSPNKLEATVKNVPLSRNANNNFNANKQNFQTKQVGYQKRFNNEIKNRNNHTNLSTVGQKSKPKHIPFQKKDHLKQQFIEVNTKTPYQHSKPKHTIFQDSDSKNTKVRSPKKNLKQQFAEKLETDQSEDSTNDDKSKVSKVKSSKKLQNVVKVFSEEQELETDQSEDSTDDDKSKVIKVKNSKMLQNVVNISKTTNESLSESSGNEKESGPEDEIPVKVNDKKNIESKKKRKNFSEIKKELIKEESEFEIVSPKKVKAKKGKKVGAPTKQSKAVREERLSRTLFVGNLPVNIKRKALEKLFSPFGPIENCRLRGAVPTKITIPKKVAAIKGEFHKGVHSRIGYVVMKEKQDAIQALSLKGLLYEGHHIIVNQAHEAGEKKNYEDKCSIFVGNLPFEIEDEAVWSTFSQFGDIEAVRVIRDKETGVGKGFGYILFQKIQSKENALAATGIEVGGRNIRIKPVESTKKNPKSTKSHTQWRAEKRIAWKEKQQQTTQSGKKSFKKIMRKGKIQLEKRKVAHIFNDLASKKK